MRTDDDHESVAARASLQVGKRTTIADAAGSIEHRPPQPEQENLTALAISMSRMAHRGPLPHPDVLLGYKNIDSGLPERVIAMAEKQASHRQARENKEDDRAERGQHYGLAIGLAGLIAATAVILSGHPAAGSIIGSVDLLGLVSVFVTGRYFQSRVHPHLRAQPDQPLQDGKPQAGDSQPPPAPPA